MQMNGIYGDVIAKDNERKAKVKQKKSKANLDEMLESDNIVDEME
jgi:hypothetical protein